MAEQTTTGRQPFLTHIGQNGWFILPVIIFWIAGIGIKCVFQHGEELLWLNPWRVEPFNSFFRHTNVWGEWPPYVVLGLPFILWRYRIVLVIAIAGLCAIPTVQVLKNTFSRPRPHTYFEINGMRDQLKIVPDVPLIVGPSSFPSGHTTSAFMLFTLLSLAVCETHRSLRIGAVFAFAAILAGFSRMFLAQHFLSDVLAGSLAGILMGSFFWWLGLKLKKYPALERGLLG
jgi:membrane-associated phospholipid phosphatase